MSSWKRVNRNKPCPICGKPDWCMIADDDSAAICARVSEGATRTVGTKGAGWLHRLRESAPPATLRRMIRVPVLAATDFGAPADKYRRAVRQADLEHLAAELGLTAASLRRLRIGWDGEAWTFPMVDATGRIVGIRRRLPAGRKLSVPGGHEGLFIPEDMDSPATLGICEGPTDTAALLDLGFAGIGRPSCTGGTRMIISTLRRWRPAETIIFADADEPGQRGATALASILRIYCPVRIVAPPAPHKDVRAFKRARGSRAELLEAIGAAPAQKLVCRVEFIGTAAK